MNLERKPNPPEVPPEVAVFARLIDEARAQGQTFFSEEWKKTAWEQVRSEVGKDGETVTTDVT